MAIRYWLGVVHRGHVRDAVRRGIVRLNHGDRESVLPLREADGIVYYSPRETKDGETLRAFTAIGRVAPGPAFAANGRTGPAGRDWRRRADWYLPAVEAPIRPLLGHLSFTSDRRNWGLQLRRGVLELSRADFDVIRQAMRMPAPEDRSPADRVVDAAPRTIEWY